MAKPTKIQLTAVSKLAAFALSCHDKLVHKGEHIDEMPPQIIEVANVLGLSAKDLVDLGQKP